MTNITDKRSTKDQVTPARDMQLEVDQLVTLISLDDPRLTVQYEVMKSFDFAIEAGRLGLDVNDPKSFNPVAAMEYIQYLLTAGFIARYKQTIN